MEKPFTTAPDEASPSLLTAAPSPLVPEATMAMAPIQAMSASTQAKVPLSKATPSQPISRISLIQMVPSIPSLTNGKS